MTVVGPSNREMNVLYYNTRMVLIGKKPACPSFLGPRHTTQGHWTLSLDPDLWLLCCFQKGMWVFFFFLLL